MKISLHHLTIAEASAEELVDIGARAGSDHLCTFVKTPSALPIPLPTVGSVARAAALRDRAASAGLSFCTIDTFVIGDTEAGDHEEMLAIGQALGAGVVNCIYRQGDLDTAVRKMSQFAAMADRYGLRLAYEWSRFSKISTLAGSVEFIRRCDMPNIGLNADILHLVRNGEGPGDLAKVDPALIAYAQLNDGPLAIAEADMLSEAISDRGFPGEGEFPVEDFVRRLPGDIVLAAEVPAVRLRPLLSAEGRARRAVEATRRIVSLARPGPSRAANETMSAGGNPVSLGPGRR